MSRITREAGTRCIGALAIVFVIAVIIGVQPIVGHAGQLGSLASGAYSAAQAARGQTLYQSKCVNCHGKELEGLVGPMLSGDVFLSRWGGRDVADLVMKIHKTMPFRAAGTLTRQEATDLAAFVLQNSKFPARSTELSDASLSGLVFPGRPAVPAVSTPNVSFRHDGSLAELMRGVTFPNANVIFNTQSNDPAEPLPKRPPRKSGNQDYFEWGLGIYPGWQAVDNAALALADTTALFLVPGRRCENGRPVPVDAPDFRQFTNAVAEIGVKIYRAAQTRDQEAVGGNLAEELSTACQNCHRVYRANNNRCVAVVPAPGR